jgi:hypothetical protein
MADQRDRAVFVISVAAELAGVHPQTLRIYEREGWSGPSGPPPTPAATPSGTSSGCWRSSG